MHCRKASSPSMTCAPMPDTPSFLPGAVRAHMCRQILHGNPHLCKTVSTFPRMTAGPVSSILEANQGARAVYGLIRKGRYDDQTSQNVVATGPRRRGALQELQRVAPDRAQFEPGLVGRVSEDGGHDRRGEPVPGLPPEPQLASHRIFCQRSHVGHRLATNTSDGPASPQNTALHREGKRQGTSLTGHSLAARANGRRDDL